MASALPLNIVRGLTDGEDRLQEADDQLAQLHMRCGGIQMGTLAVPELLEIVRQSRRKGLRLAREFRAFDGSDTVFGFVRVVPERADGQPGCEMSIQEWRHENHLEEAESVLSHRTDAIDQMVAELSARLDPELRVLSVISTAPDLQGCAMAMERSERGHWTDFVHLSDADYSDPLHWRLIDGAKVAVKGSMRDWRIRLLPRGGVSQDPEGFEMLLVSEQPWLVATENERSDTKANTLVGGELTRVLRQPISRIISNAETIRARLAGPLREEYTNYAGDIASAGSHLLALLDDLADLEAVEESGFEVAHEAVDLADVAERAVGILRSRSQAKQISVEVDGADAPYHARGEFRRVLQILINLIGNAINYSPNGSTVHVTFDQSARSAVSVSDQGPGLDSDEQGRVFTKFERLGREGDGGSGLGLYISRRLANAMDGELSVDSKKGEGATFTLELPLSDAA